MIPIQVRDAAIAHERRPGPRPLVSIEVFGGDQLALVTLDEGPVLMAFAYQGSARRLLATVLFGEVQADKDEEVTGRDARLPTVAVESSGTRIIFGGYGKERGLAQRYSPFPEFFVMFLSSWRTEKSLLFKNSAE